MKDVIILLQTKLQNVESENNSPSYPRVPLLRVRNLVGDRLSTPKDFKDNAEESAGEVANSEEDSKTSTSDTEKHLKDEAPAMFTIENVRSLNSKDNPEESNLQVEDLVPEQDKESSEDGKAATAKPVIVRSCPTRKIAIRPDSNSHSIEVGHLKVVKTATVTPVVLSSLTNITPIRILSSLTPSSKRSKFSVQPVMVSASPPFLPPSKAVSVILPVSSTTSTTSSVTTVTTTAETIVSQQKIPNEEGATEKNACTSIETLLNGPTKSGKLPSKRVRTKVYRANHDGTSSSEVEEMDESKQKSINALQKLSSPSVGNKSVKDAKIYQEMLTKTKLCHLFKCMAIECSFTCNSESVFTQHIGLHEAQRRMKNQKSWKNNGVESNYKTRKVFNWHQCAYCCEVLANTSFALSRHIIVEHGHCIYQCAYCFYRAVSQSYVEIHQVWNY